VAARDALGRARSPAEIDAECGAHLEEARRAGRRVLLHVLDQSKTGLLLPSDVDRLLALAGGAEVLVDASQARLSPRSVQSYLRRGFMVLVTGSKFFTGPPFSGALLLPEAVGARLRAERSLPEGLRDYWGRFDWPAGAACAVLPPEANLGVALRWEAALAEMEAFSAVNDGSAQGILTTFVRQVREGIAAQPALRLLESPELARPLPREWDACPTILAFSTWVAAAGGGNRPLSPDEARQVFRWLNADLAPALGIGVGEPDRSLAARRFHIGQPVALATTSGPIGALRICAGARLVSGEPSQATLAPPQRLERETADALAILEKISLIIRHRELLARVDPLPEL
jgi:hypothetical protein